MAILDLVRKLSPDEHRRGRQFERICKWFLENDPEYKREIKRVWLWDEWPGRWGRDKGIDLVAETLSGKFWAIQSKAYALTHSVTKSDMDKFLSESSRKIISYRLLITTAAEIGHNAREVIKGQEKPVGTLFFSDLKNRKLNWPSSPENLVAKQEQPNKARPDQKRAIADVVRGFKLHDRGQLIRACGTGKTLIGLRVAEAMKTQRTLVLVPGLSLVSQILSDWAKDGLRPFRFLPVCSDETIGKEDQIVSVVRELGLPANTDPSEIAEFLRGSGARVIFSTYKSAPKIALAFKQHKLKPFDLVIADEAHRCAGAKDSEYATIHDPQAIRARRRLFMTATPRIASEASKSRADSMGLELVSMDDHEVFGPVFHELKFSDAIRLKLLTDYRVEIIGVDHPLYRQYAEQGVFVTLDGKTVTDARTLASHIAVAKAVNKYDLRRIITFHGRIPRAREFAEQFPQFIRWMPKADRPSGEIWAELISCELASDKRNAILDRLREVEAPARGIVTNKQCLSEGVDVRALDGVAFIDPKESQVDIIQAVGRAIRKAERKRHGIIILPVYISSDEDEEMTLEDSSFKQVWRVLRALRSHDDQLASELDNLRTNLGKRRKVRAHLPAKININLPTRLNAKFADAFYLRTVRAITQSWDERFGELKAYKERFKDCNVHVRWPENRRLGIWVVAQRQAKKFGQLSERQIQQLDSLGFEWRLQTGWDEMFERLVAFKEKYKRCDVQQKWKEDPQLGRWVLSQRNRYAAGTLEDDRHRKLKSIGFIWHAGGTSWDHMFLELVAYKRKHGHFDVSTDENPKLAQWVRYQRRLKKIDELKPEKIKRLNGINFNWDSKAKDANRWEEMFKQLLAYKAENGDCKVPTTWKDSKLVNWVTGLRRAKRYKRKSLSPEQIRRLNEIDFVWDTKRNRLSWDEMFSLLVEYKRQHDDCKVPGGWPDNPQLASWVANQRSAKKAKKLSPEKIHRLNKIGFEWEIRKNYQATKRP